MKRKILLILIIFLIITISIILIYPKEENKILDGNKKSNNSFISMMLESDVGSNKFVENADLKFPLEGYHFNSEESGCENGGTLTWNSEKQKIEASLITSDKCYAYFDNVQVKSEFAYTGNYEEYVVPSTGTYKIELWGASGGNTNVTYTCNPNSYGRGAYTKGNIFLKKGEKLYIYIGETKEIYDSENLVFNGAPGESVGGGATDIRLKEGLWNEFESLKSRIMVAAGGGGCTLTTGTSQILDNPENQRGDGGALTGFDAKWYYQSYSNPGTFDYSGRGASQTNGGEPGTLFSQGIDPQKIPEMVGKFGIGGYGINATGTYKYTSSGGGGGYYGGGHGNHTDDSWTGGGGGSSFISGYPGCDAIDEKSTEDAIIHTNQPNHYSGKIFTDSEMIAGNATMPSPDGGTEVGHTGKGFAKITLIK